MDVLIVVQGGKVNVGKIRNRNLKNIIMNITGLRKTHRVDFNPRPVVPGCAGCAMAHPDFGRSVNPISTSGNRLCPPNYYWHTQIFRPSDGPAIYCGCDYDKMK